MTIRQHDPAEEGVRFGAYRFEMQTGRLWLGAEEVRLTPKASSVLKELVTHAGTPVSKDDLFATVWSGTIVSDDALTSCVKELRRALDDDPKQPRYIETRHRRGYRFMAAVSESSMAPASAPAPRSDAISSIAVLRFADMSPDRNQDYLCDGFAEELINALTHIEGLRVAARTASFQFRAPGADVREVGRRLGVGALLEGSVRKAESRLRVTVQLIETDTGYHRWSQRFDSTLDDVFAIQDEIAERVVALLRGSVVSGSEKQAFTRPRTQTEAYDYYLRGRQNMHRIAAPDLQRSEELFTRALALAPGYAPAWAGLTTVHATRYEWLGASDRDLAKAERASQRALELAPTLSETHVARGCVLSLSHRYQEAARAFEQAISLNPRSFEGYYYFARSLVASGDIPRAVELFRKAADTRPEDFQSPLFMAQCLRGLKRSGQASDAGRESIRRAEHTLALNPDDARALSVGSLALFEDGQRVRAFEWLQRCVELQPDDVCVLANAACLRAKPVRMTRH